MIPALAFVQPDRVIGSFEELIDHPEFPDDALPLVNYFEDVYIGRRQRRGRQLPTFPIAQWNVHDRTLAGMQRTNNDVEGI